MPRSRFIYVISMSSIFHVRPHFHQINHIMFLNIFKNISNYFWMIRWMKKEVKVQSQGFA